MTWYAHATIHDHKTDTVYTRGNVVENPEEIDGWDELVGGGALKEEDYDPSADEVGPPAQVEVDGVRYVRAEDGFSSQEASS